MKNTVTQAQIDALLQTADVETMTVFDKCTIVVAKLPNGFVLVEHSACVDPANYNEEQGREICMKRIADKLWELEGYALQKQLAAISAPVEKWTGDNLKFVRKAAGLTQEQLAEAVGVHQVQVARWEKGAEPGVVVLHKMACAIGCSMDDLV